MLVQKEMTSMEEKIVKVLNEMSAYLTIAQMKKLQEIMLDTFAENKIEKSNVANNDFLQMFLDAKKIEGCSGRTIQYYQTTILHMFSKMNVPIRKITTEEIRAYLSEYQENSHCTNVTVDNIRRNISSFFSWLEEEDYILKSPMKRIHKIKTKTVVKSVISDEGIEKLRDYCTESRDLAIIDLLYSTGIRVGDDDDKIRLNQRKPSKYKGLRRFGPEKNLQRINKFMKERPIFYKNLIQMKENIRFYLRCFYCITKVMILQFNSENRTELARNG